MLGRVWSAFDRGERRRLGGFFGLVALLHVVGFGLLIFFGLSHPELIGLGGLAYTFGLRHAFDADHISAIDNSTRKLLHDGRRPMGAGFFFSLGHSTVVLLIALGLGLATQLVVHDVVGSRGSLHVVGGLIGTGVSGVFLIVIGLLNLAVLVDIVRVYTKMKSGQYDRASLRHELVAGGLMTRLFGRLFRVVRQSWDMYPIGFLFGLGFDTASEVALLAISAGVAARGLSVAAVLALPVVFAAGMSLMDTADGAFMAKAYSWAFSSPVRKVFYNLTITGLSVFVALLVGGVEVGQIVIRTTGLHGGAFEFISTLDLGTLGFVIVGAFILTWAVALTIFKLRRVDERWGKLVPGE